VSSHYLKSVISLGTLLEWAEYTFYGYLAITLSTLFFPESNFHVSILKAFGVFAAGYLMRPIGAIIFGHIGDRFGRKPALVGSLCLMGIATMGIGCLPTYATMGVIAPLLLLVLRMLQGIAVSGEHHGAGIFLIETSKHSPCLTSSWVSTSAALGMVVGGIAAFLVSQPFAPFWAWRIPFLLGGTSCFIGLWLRMRISPTLLPSSSRTLPLLEVLQNHKKSLLLTGAMAAFTGVYVYIGNIYIVVFLKQYAQLPTHHATFFCHLR